MVVNMKIIETFFIFLGIVVLKRSTAEYCHTYNIDPCLPENHIVLDDPSRSVDYYNPEEPLISGEDELPINQWRWYRSMIPGAEDIALVEPEEHHCQTEDPFWVNVNNGNFLYRSDSWCPGLYHLPYYYGHHGWHSYGHVYVCEEFNVYYWSNWYYTHAHNGEQHTHFHRLCFGGPVECPNDYRKELCENIFKPKQYLKIIPGTFETLMSNEQCQTETSYSCVYYDTGNGRKNVTSVLTWYVDGDIIKEVYVEDLEEPSILTITEIWNKHGKANTFNLKCELTLNDTALNDTALVEKYSGEYQVQAGLTSHTDTLKLTEGSGPEYYTAEFTFPYKCTHECGSNTSCKNVNVHLQAKVQGNALISFTENNGLIKRSASCNVFSEVTQTEDVTIIQVPVVPVTDGRYGGTKVAILEFLAELSDNAGNLLWEGAIPKTEVLIVDNDATIAGKHCSIYNDPHIITFDGSFYELQKSGSFIMYRHTRLPIEVQAYFENRGRYSAVCSVAVRSGGDIYVVDYCTKNRLDARYLQCEGSPTLHIERGQNGNQYKIYLPTGGIVTITRNRITITPALVDLSSTEGACGVLSDKCEDDFKLRNLVDYERLSCKLCWSCGGYVYPYIFVESWRVDYKDSLFAGEIQYADDRVFPDEVYCECDENGEQVCNTISDQRNSNGNEIIDVSRQKCVEQKRSIVYTDDVEDDDSTYTYDSSFVAPEPVWHGGWTENTSYAFCNDYFSNRTSVKLCQDMELVNLQDNMDTCVQDIFISGTTDYATVQLDMMLSICTEEIEKNDTLVESNTTDSTSGAVNLLQELLHSICPGDCYDHGDCVKGVCECEDSYSGYDCSVEKDYIPTLLDLPSNGLCDKSSRPCEATPVYADLYIVSDNLMCAVQVLNLERKAKSEETYHPAELVHFQKILCQIPSSSLPYITQITVSNNNADYSEPKHLLVYDSTCWECTLEAGCSKRHSTCVINGECIPSGMTNPTKEDEACDPNSDEYDWSNINEDEGGDTATKTDLIVGITVSASVVVLVVIVIVIIYKCNRSKTTKLVLDVDLNAVPVTVPTKTQDSIPPEAIHGEKTADLPQEGV